MKMPSIVDAFLLRKVCRVWFVVGSALPFVQIVNVPSIVDAFLIREVPIIPIVPQPS